MTEDALLILVAGALLATGVLASLVAARLRLPSLVLFLGLGMLIGTDGLGWIDFENYELTRLIGSIALLLILFEGGLAAGFDEIRPVLRPAISLAIVATVGTALIVGLAATVLIVALIARPLAAAAATAFERFSARDRLLLGWTGLRGAVPVILATFPVIEDIPRSLEFFNVVFFAVLVSTLIQGSTVEILANRLGLTEQAAD